MTKKEFERRARLTAALTGLGFTEAEADQLRRISNTLQRWHELECGTGDGHIEKSEISGKWMFKSSRATGPWYYIPDRETGARKRLAGILARVNEFRGAASGALDAYIQTDPRGAALYIIRPGDVPEGADVSAYYSRGICVY